MSGPCTHQLRRCAPDHPHEEPPGHLHGHRLRTASAPRRSPTAHTRSPGAARLHHRHTFVSGQTAHPCGELDASRPRTASGLPALRSGSGCFACRVMTVRCVHLSNGLRPAGGCHSSDGGCLRLSARLPSDVLHGSRVTASPRFPVRFPGRFALRVAGFPCGELGCVAGGFSLSADARRWPAAGMNAALIEGGMAGRYDPQ